MPTYVAETMLFIDGRRVRQGEEFRSPLPPGKHWRKIADDPPTEKADAQDAKGQEDDEPAQGHEVADGQDVGEKEAKGQEEGAVLTADLFKMKKADLAAFIAGRGGVVEPDDGRPALLKKAIALKESADAAQA